jgi:hypothetical protein
MPISPASNIVNNFASGARGRTGIAIQVSRRLESHDVHDSAYVPYGAFEFPRRDIGLRCQVVTSRWEVLPSTRWVITEVKPANHIEAGLRGIELPPLVRPPVGPFDEPTEVLVLWGIRDYAYCSIAHIRTVLAGLIDLAATGNQPTIFIVCRHIFEWTMHSCYMVEGLRVDIQNADWKQAWELLLGVSTGNNWVKTHGSKYFDVDFDDLPNSLRIKKLVKAYERHQTATIGHEDVQDSYGYLSEHAHANAACFLSYTKIRGSEVSFVDAPRVHGFPGVLHASVIDWVMFTYKLLCLAKEDPVRLQLLKIINSLADTARQEKL